MRHTGVQYVAALCLFLKAALGVEAVDGISDNSFFAFALPSDKQAANATAHNATTTPKRLGYGNYCGPNPDLNVSTGCRQSYPALDIVDEGCMHHDWAYCECDKIYTNSNRVPPSSILTVLRGSLPANQTASFDRNYLKCAHDADVKLLATMEGLVHEGKVPMPDWDEKTRTDFNNSLGIFRRNMAFDAHANITRLLLRSW